VKVLGIIPARGGSKRLPRKNLLPLDGRSLLERTLSTALAARLLTELVVSSDDEEILAEAERVAPGRALRRPAELATDEARAIDAVQHAVASAEARRGERFDAVAVLQCTSPLTLPEDVDATIDLLQATGADSAVSVVRVAHDVHPLKLKRLVGDRLEPFIEDEAGRFAAQELPEVYVRNCAVYVATRALVAAGRLIGDDCRGYVMPRERSVDINDELDLAFAEFLLSRRPRP
jgi:CMP-N-acetylneuraminic acid synthetase